MSETAKDWNDWTSCANSHEMMWLKPAMKADRVN